MALCLQSLAVTFEQEASELRSMHVESLHLADARDLLRLHVSLALEVGEGEQNWQFWAKIHFLASLGSHRKKTYNAAHLLAVINSSWV